MLSSKGRRQNGHTLRHLPTSFHKRLPTHVRAMHRSELQVLQVPPASWAALQRHVQADDAQKNKKEGTLPRSDEQVRQRSMPRTPSVLTNDRNFPSPLHGRFSPSKGEALLLNLGHIHNDRIGPSDGKRTPVPARGAKEDGKRLLRRGTWP